ncbi:(2Fe-2S)-binding protein [Acuticoccus sediminis]|uniref:(2Fe-2S)-binding protein n=1 Tax=Acuticoccus sediminis TaxID=2184697 RepID=UPI001CFE18AA|nr:(2Fe-2S)-binding protein [Acuticoccus sediminis]
MTGFARVGESRRVTILVDGNPVEAREGDSVALALMASGRLTIGTGPTPYCLMGVCFGCLCTIDGRPSEQACMTPVREGLSVTTEAAS